MSIPNEFFCPITYEVMREPVILMEDGRSYEKSALQTWLQTNNTSPMTNKILTRKDFVLNINLKNAIEAFLDDQVKGFRIKNGKPPRHLLGVGSPQLAIKICLLGDASVGKTKMLKYLQYSEGASDKIYEVTMGPDITILHLDHLFQNRYVVTISVFDLPGEPRCIDVWKSQYRCHGAILVCDASLPKTLNNIEEKWYPTLKKYGYDEIECILACNQIDRVDISAHSQSQLFEQAGRFSISNGISLIYTSAVTGKNIQSVFNQLVLSILNNNVILKELIGTKVTSCDKLDSTSSKNKSSCC